MKSSFKVAGIILLVVVSFSLFGNIMGWFSGAIQVAQEEFNPRAMLTKYEWFKRTAAELDKKVADISVYKSKLSTFDGMSRKDMDRTDKEQLALWNQEIAGVTASYNGLAAEWNAQISQFHWKSFVGDLPAGASDLLSSNYAPYSRK